jgi:hypothetical protein
MHVLQHADGTVSAYVTNYDNFDQNPGNADLALSRTSPGATVCMEYSAVERQTTRIVKFFVFAGNGNGARRASPVPISMGSLRNLSLISASVATVALTCQLTQPRRTQTRPTGAPASVAVTLLPAQWKRLPLSKRT